ncbi:sedoheptulokinase [Paenibacillus sp. sgz5001063]|uniref:sedoheptulokinase n=1 Tax=Paenibacillus sp. sgz5001063 TaxID=3242474 RepID=UPI0036D3EBCF
MRIIGIDIGTTSITGMVYDLEQRRTLHSITEKNAAQLNVSQQEWERLQDPSIILNIVHGILSKLLEWQPGIQGIGLTGQMHGILYTDASGKHLTPLYTWQDGRGGQPYDKDYTFAQKLGENTGYAVFPGYGLVTHFYNLQHSLVPPETVSFCTIADYAAMRLAGRTLPLIDSTQAAGLGCYSITEGDFDKEAITRSGISTELLPKVAPSGTLLGLTLEGVPVFTSLGDNQASFLGSVPFPEESLLLNIGTGSQFSVMLNHSGIPVEGLEARPYPGGGVLMVGAALSGGKSYALLEKFIRQLIEAYTGESHEDMYAFMDILLRDGHTPGHGLSVNPQFMGTRSKPDARGSIEGITLDNFTPGLLIQAFLQGMVDELYAFYDRIMKMSPENHWTGLIGSGNALRANPALCTKVEERFGLPLTLSSASEEAAVGAALCAAVGAGMIGSFKEAGQYLG